MFIDNEEDNELENELVVEEGVPETPETEEQIETDASEEVDNVQEATEKVEQTSADIEKQIEERANRIAEQKIEARLIRDRVKRERDEAPQRAKYEQLTNIMKTALGADSLDDVITKSRKFYEEQGITIPEVTQKSFLNERDEKILAKADAEEIISLGRTEMEIEANRIASIPQEQRSVREKVVFNTICKKLINMKDEEGLKNKGYDTKILDNKDFLSFREQFAINKPVSEIYEMYRTVKGIKPTQPKSPGSAKTTQTNNEIKDYYSPEDFDKLTAEDLRNPKVMEVVDKSRLQWFKRS